MPRKNVHVTKRADGYAVISEGAKRATRVDLTQAEAIKIAKQIAQNNQGELFIHGRDNKIRERNSYGNDPYPPRG